MGHVDKDEYSDKHVAYQPPPLTAEEEKELQEMYRQMDDLHMKPLWNQIGGLMPNSPEPRAIAHKWEWKKLYALAARSGELVPVGRGGERRAIGLANPGLGGPTYIAPTLWLRSSTWRREKTPRNTATRRMPSASFSKARASGPLSTATQSRCAAVTSC